MSNYYHYGNDKEIAYGRYKQSAKRRKTKFLRSLNNKSKFKCKCGATMSEEIWRFQKENRKGGAECMRCTRKKERKEEKLGGSDNKLMFYKK